MGLHFGPGTRFLSLSLELFIIDHNIGGSYAVLNYDFHLTIAIRVSTLIIACRYSTVQTPDSIVTIRTVP
jgi:hypothetical protein